MHNYGWLIVSVFCSSFAHACLKKGSGSLGLSKLSSLLTNEWLLAGIALHGIALIFWVVGLSKVPLTQAYPFLALGYILVLGLGAWWFNERLTWIQFAGTGLVVLGLLLITREAT